MVLNMNKYFENEIEILLTEYKERGSRVNNIEIEQDDKNKFVVLFKDKNNNLLTFSHDLESQKDLESYLLTTFGIKCLMLDLLVSLQ